MNLQVQFNLFNVTLKDKLVNKKREILTEFPNSVIRQWTADWTQSFTIYKRNLES